MANRSFRIRPVWDPEAGIFYSEGDIVGLHIEAGSFEEFERLVMELGPELIIANHLSDEELASTLRDLVPAILIERPSPRRVEVVKGYYQAVIRILKELGFEYVQNSKGSHEKWRKGKVTLTVPRNLMSRHTANGILKDAGSDEHL